MRYSNLLKVLALPLLFPLSVLYSFGAFLNRTIHFNPHKSKFFSLSVGNLQVGGTGKTPITLELIRQFLEKNIDPIIISKSYKASLHAPKEVSQTDRALEVGDEALMLKKSFPEVRVFSGPVKVKTLKFAEEQIKHNSKSLFILDDGAQHHKIKKDFKVHVWDGSRSFFDLFSFPLGSTRECLFLSESSDFTFINRDQKSLLSKVLKFFFKNKIDSLDFQIQKIENVNGKPLDQNAILISGVGNFKHLKLEVEEYLKVQRLSLKGQIKGLDHDSFKKTNLNSQEIYICTEKDHDKLKEKVTVENLYVVKSDFTQTSSKSISRVVEMVSLKMEVK